MILQLLQEHAIPYRKVAYTAGTYLYQAGENLHHLYYLTQGCVCLLGEQHDNCLRYINQPRMLSMPDLLRKRYILSALVLENCTVVEIDQEKLLEYVAGHPRLLYPCLKQICREMETESVSYE